MYIINAKKLFQICFMIIVGIFVYCMMYLYTKIGSMHKVMWHVQSYTKLHLMDSDMSAKEMKREKDFTLMLFEIPSPQCER